MHFYGLTLHELLHMPVVTFWMLHKNVDRIQAERDAKTAELMVRSQSADGIKELFDGLRKQMGQVVVIERPAAMRRPVEQLDRAGLNELRGLGRVG
jgi:hypothetical protein